MYIYNDIISLWDFSIMVIHMTFNHHDIGSNPLNPRFRARNEASKQASKQIVS